MAKKQKEIFLETEGDAWFERNHQAIENRVYGDDDPVVCAINSCLGDEGGLSGQLLEVGCGEGKRLEWIQQNTSLNCFGVDPSRKAVSLAQKRGVQAVQSTADILPYDDQSFDFIVFGFCLYLCDREDLFQIAAEADRVLKANSWLIINDFFASVPNRRDYHHRSGIYSHKMDYRQLFDWHPSYTCFSHQIGEHGQGRFTDDPNEWVATSILRKHPPK